MNPATQYDNVIAHTGGIHPDDSASTVGRAVDGAHQPLFTPDAAAAFDALRDTVEQAHDYHRLYAPFLPANVDDRRGDDLALPITLERLRAMMAAAPEPDADRALTRMVAEALTLNWREWRDDPGGAAALLMSDQWLAVRGFDDPNADVVHASAREAFRVLGTPTRPKD